MYHFSLSLCTRSLPSHAPQEDSLGNCGTLTPKAPTPSYTRFATMDGKVLRFSARMLGPDDPETAAYVGEGAHSELTAVLATHPFSPVYVSSPLCV